MAKTLKSQVAELASFVRENEGVTLGTLKRKFSLKLINVALRFRRICCIHMGDTVTDTNVTAYVDQCPKGCTRKET